MYLLYQILRPTIGTIPIRRVAAKIGDKIIRMTTEAIMMVAALMKTEILVLSVS